MADIVLTTLNAKYIHAAFGLRYLLANLGPLRAAAAHRGVRHQPAARGHRGGAPGAEPEDHRAWAFTSGTWRPRRRWSRPSSACGRTSRSSWAGRRSATKSRRSPSCNWPTTSSPAKRIWRSPGSAGNCSPGNGPTAKIIPAELPEFSELALPYDLYDEQDVAHRIIYVEASRGCPFSCEFCLSSLDIPVRQAPLPGVARAPPAPARPRA